ncbi:MAG TPA: class I SAM-dependent methyltransferase [Trebonia sp.]|jgi:SAM-dependent methyltransferase|nr:class I SAM-dependent methyltransferase [Trebonia sp.]
MADTHDHHDHHTHHQHGHRHSGAAEDDYTDLLELDAEVLRDYWADALDWVQTMAAGAARTRLLDLGAGTGTGAIGLARRFPDAEVVALDVSPVSVAKIAAKAAAADLGGRVKPVEADLDAGWPDLGPLDLTWASASLHHMADPARVLRDALDATRPGGLIAVSEFASQLLFLPDDLGFGRAGFEGRVTDVLGHAYTEEMPTLGSQWAPRLADAGWAVVAEREFLIDMDPPTHPSATRYASGWFARLSDGLADRLEPDDQATLAALLDAGSPRALVNRTDLHIRGGRTITIGRRD